ncbi:MAG: ATP synthase F0 subunit C [Pyrinomonadaceae bacterium]
MNKYKYIFFSVLVILTLSTLAFAQDEATKAALLNPQVMSYKAIGAGIGFGIAAGLGAIGQGKIGAAAVEGAARNPGAAGTVQTLMIIGLALIESLVLFALVIVFVVLR